VTETTALLLKTALELELRLVWDGKAAEAAGEFRGLGGSFF
jgi:hypothetical protein